MLTEDEQREALHRVAVMAAHRQTNVAMMQVDGPPTPIWGLVAVGVPDNKAIQVVCVVGGYDIWAKGGTEMESANVSAEVASERLVRQYLEYKHKRIKGRRV